ncbi:MAG: iron-containing alcohol dehydrogenase family protein [Butyricicoccus sp.]
MENYTILPAPYTVGPEAYTKMADYCPLYGTKAVVIGGAKAMNAAREKLIAAAEQAGVELLDFVCFGKECTFEGAARLEQLEAVQQADMIFAVGGGKAVDTCKLVSIDLHKPYFAFPTIASNCAASSALAIVYHEDGSFCDFVHFLDSAKHVFIDTDIIAHAPIEYLWAGIGDTYAKYYEVSFSARGEQLEHFKAMGVNMSRMCMETLVQHGAAALRDNKTGTASYELEQAALAIIITTGWVSMLVSRDHTMDYNGGLAHAFFYGLCNIPGFDEDHLHGVVVGFGVLLMLLTDGQEDECRKLMEFNKTVGLPTRLSELNVTLEQVAEQAESMTRDEDLEHFPYRITADMIVEAARKLDV